MIKIIIVMLLAMQTANAGEILDMACKSAANMGRVGYGFQTTMSRDEFFKQAEPLTPLKRQSVTIGYLSDSEEQAFSDAFSNCLNYKESLKTY